MGCECCKFYDPDLTGIHGGCTASKKIRQYHCGVSFPDEKASFNKGSNYTRPKKKRKR